MSSTEEKLPHGLYVVATPIGNLGDISARAREILSRVDRIACEDTRHTGKLLSFLGIQRPMFACHEHNEHLRAQEVVRHITDGGSIACVSDAGTPAISDPGFRLVRACRAANLPVITIPGPAALIAALSVSGLPTDSFRFLGFLPPKKAARLRIFEQWKDETATIVFYESTHRIEKCVTDLIEVLGGERVICVARELTKLHESIHTGTAFHVQQILQKTSTKGEFVVMIAKNGYSLNEQ